MLLIVSALLGWFLCGTFVTGTGVFKNQEVNYIIIFLLLLVWVVWLFFLVFLG